MSQFRDRCQVIALGIVLSCLPLLSPAAFALDPALDVSQYAHTAWRVRDGFPGGAVGAIAQTPDGYLWLGTEFGLIRFDGVRGVPLSLPPDQHLPSTVIKTLLVSRDGTLWIGTEKGLASWRDAKLVLYSEFLGRIITKLLEDRDGTIWIGEWYPSGRLCSIRGGNIRCEGEDILGSGVAGLYEDGKSNLWVGSAGGAWRWKPGAAKFYPVPSDYVRDFAEDSDGTLLIGASSSVQRLASERIQAAYPLPPTPLPTSPFSILRDRNGGIWVGTASGIVHVHARKTDVFSQLDGLTGNRIAALFEDREGNIWVGTLNGLDRFREFAVTTFTLKQGFSVTGGTGVLSTRDDSLWFATTQGLGRLKNGQLTIYGSADPQTDQTKPRAAIGIRLVDDSGIPARFTTPLFEDDNGRIWISTAGAVGYIEHDRFKPMNSTPGYIASSMVQVAGGDRWIGRQLLGLFRFLPTGEVQQVPWSKFGNNGWGTTLIADTQRGFWIGFYDGGVARVSERGELLASYGKPDGLGEGRVGNLHLDAEGALWAATQGGLSRVKNNRAATLNSRNGLPCDEVQWVAADNDAALWLMTPCGLVRISRMQLDTWAAALERGENPPVQVTVFDNFDGVRGAADLRHLSPPVAKSADGKLWFSTLDGLGVVDPHRFPFNPLPPPVFIERVTADRETYSTGSASLNHLPPLIRDLRIDYTALSYVVPEKVRFRYKLEGKDKDWQDVGTRRQAFYNDLAPGNYRFRVIASNNNGVWNETGATLDFSVSPAYYQTLWFRASLVAGLMALLGAGYRMRMRQIAERFDLRMQERMRIAQDLHDTLLQGCLSASMQLHLVVDHLEDASPVKPALTRIQQLMAQVIDEGRTALRGLRFADTDTHDLEKAFLRTQKEVDAAGRIKFRVIVEGKPRPLHPLIRDEVYRIGREAILNAFRHARAQHIEVEIDYLPKQLRLAVRDDGFGIDPAVASSGRDGHFGLSGMRERAGRIGGRLGISSRMTAGTEIDVTVPGKTAYQIKPSRAALWLQKLRGKVAGARQKEVGHE